MLAELETAEIDLLELSVASVLPSAYTEMQIELQVHNLTEVLVELPELFDDQGP